MSRFKMSDTFKIHRKMCRFSGIWPDENPILSYRLRTFTTWFLSIGVTSCMMVQAIHDINDFTKLSQTIYIMISWIAYMIKLAGFMYYGKEILHVINFLDDPIFSSFPEQYNFYLLKQIRYITILSNIMRVAYLSIAVLYLVYPMLDEIPLPFPFPYDLGRYLPLMYAFQSIGETSAVWNYASLDSFCIGLIAIATAQLDVLEAKLLALNQTASNSNEGDTKKVIGEYIKQCCKHHLAIIKLVELLERIFTVGLLAQFFASVVISCNTVFQFMWVSLSWEFFLLAVYFISLTMQIFMYCWYGNELIVKSLSIGDACYMSKWYDCDRDVRKSLFIIMERSKKPLQITTMKISVLSLAAFMALYRWSYSLLTLLLNMYQKKQIQ